MNTDSASVFHTPARCVRFTAAGVVLAIGAFILAPFPNYVPPDFDTGFLRNKRDFFFGSGYLWEIDSAHASTHASQPTHLLISSKVASWTSFLDVLASAEREIPDDATAAAAASPPFRNDLLEICCPI